MNEHTNTRNLSLLPLSIVQFLHLCQCLLVAEILGRRPSRLEPDKNANTQDSKEEEALFEERSLGSVVARLEGVLLHIGVRVRERRRVRDGGRRSLLGRGGLWGRGVFGLVRNTGSPFRSAVFNIWRARERERKRTNDQHCSMVEGREANKGGNGSVQQEQENRRYGISVPLHRSVPSPMVF